MTPIISDDAAITLRCYATRWEEATENLRQAREEQAIARNAKIEADAKVEKYRLAQINAARAMSAIIFANTIDD